MSDEPMAIGDWHDDDDYRRERRHEDAVRDFRRLLRDERQGAQNAVRALYPRLTTGVSVQEIQQTIDEALYWLAIPDDWAERYADECENWDTFDDERRFASRGIEWWIKRELYDEQILTRQGR